MKRGSLPIESRSLAFLLLLSLLATLIYSNSFSASFHLDDPLNILENSKIRHLDFSCISNSRYVGFLTFALNYRFGGLDVFGYHLVNLFIHIANGFLVYTLVLLLFRAASTDGGRIPKEDCYADALRPYASLIALATALLFIAHPIQTQAVTYIVQRFTSLATLFYLLGVVGYIKWRLENKFLWYGVALISTILGMKSKEFVFTLPLMILLIETVFFWPRSKRRWVSLIPFLLTLFIIPLSDFDVIGKGEAFLTGTTEISRLDYIFTQFRVIVTYLRLLVLPIGQNLDYDYPIYHSLFAPPVFFSFLFLSSFFGLAVYFLRRAIRQPSPVSQQLKLTAFGILWFFLTLSAESSIIPIHDVIFEHRLYLPSAGAFLAVCAALASSRRRLIGLISMGTIILIFSAAAYRRNWVWQNEMTLWEDVVKKAPKKARAHNNLGNAYKGMGRFEEAFREYQTAIRLQPDYADAHNNLGISYKVQGRLEESLREYQTAIRLQPDHADAHNNLGDYYNTLGRFDEAAREFQAAVKIKPNLADVHYNLGVIYTTQGRLDEAIQEYQITLQLQPNDTEARQALNALIRLTTGEGD